MHDLHGSHNGLRLKIVNSVVDSTDWCIFTGQVSDDYALRQSHADRQYKKAWETVPNDFKASAAALGIVGPQVEEEGKAVEYDADLTNSSYTTDLSAVIDTKLEEMTEKYGNPIVIRAIVKEVEAVINQKCQEDYSHKLVRIIMVLISAESSNLLAKVHHIIHAVPGLAKNMGINSLRHSARECKCSVEWIRKGRDKICEILEIPIPSEGKKSDEAKAEYKNVATTRHWRNRMFKAQKPAHFGCDKCLTEPVLSIVEGPVGSRKKRNLCAACAKIYSNQTQPTAPQPTHENSDRTPGTNDVLPLAGCQQPAAAEH